MIDTKKLKNKSINKELEFIDLKDELKSVPKKKFLVLGLMLFMFLFIGLISGFIIGHDFAVNNFDQEITISDDCAKSLQYEKNCNVLNPESADECAYKSLKFKTCFFI